MNWRNGLAHQLLVNMFALNNHVFVACAGCSSYESLVRNKGDDGFKSVRFAQSMLAVTIEPFASSIAVNHAHGTRELALTADYPKPKCYDGKCASSTGANYVQ